MKGGNGNLEKLTEILLTMGSVKMLLLFGIILTLFTTSLNMQIYTDDIFLLVLVIL